MKKTGFLCIVLLSFVSQKSYSNPVCEVNLLGVEFFSPSGERFVSRGFWDGENTWKVRFLPNQTGHADSRTVIRWKMRGPVATTLKTSPEQHNGVLEYRSPVKSDAILILFKKN